MRPALFLVALWLAAPGLAGCAATVDTLPPLVSASAPVQRLTLHVPEGFEIRSVDFDASLFSDAAPGTTTVSSEVRGRSFVKAYAVDRATGVQYLLLYENIEARAEPVQIIRFEERPMP